MSQDEKIVSWQDKQLDLLAEKIVDVVIDRVGDILARLESLVNETHDE